jgi:hypothetical protein
MQQVYSMMSGTYFDAVDARVAQQRAASLRTQAAERLTTAIGAAKTSLEAFTKKLDAIAAGPTDTLAAVAGSLGGLINALGAADVQPTANQSSAITTARATAARVMARWRAIETVDLPALNAALKAAGAAPIK